jgi:hypothetical protein
MNFLLLIVVFLTAPICCCLNEKLLVHWENLLQKLTVQKIVVSKNTKIPN